MSPRSRRPSWTTWCGSRIATDVPEHPRHETTDPHPAPSCRHCARGGLRTGKSGKGERRSQEKVDAESHYQRRCEEIEREGEGGSGNETAGAKNRRAEELSPTAGRATEGSGCRRQASCRGANEGDRSGERAVP